MFVDNNDKTLNMFCTRCLQFSSILASKMMNNCSFQYLVCKNDNVLVNEIAPIAFSHNEDFAIVHVNHVLMLFLHMHHAYYDSFLDANGDMQLKRCIMMDDVFIYHAHTLFALSMVCVGANNTMSTSMEHQLTKRALECIIEVSSRSNPAL